MNLAAPSPKFALQDPAALVAAPEAMAFAALMDRVRTLLEEWSERRRHAAARRDSDLPISDRCAGSAPRAGARGSRP
jgi:hypothetical protein